MAWRRHVLLILRQVAGSSGGSGSAVRFSCALAKIPYVVNTPGATPTSTTAAAMLSSRLMVGRCRRGGLLHVLHVLLALELLVLPRSQLLVVLRLLVLVQVLVVLLLLVLRLCLILALVLALVLLLVLCRWVLLLLLLLLLLR